MADRYDTLRDFVKNTFPPSQEPSQEPALPARFGYARLPLCRDPTRELIQVIDDAVSGSPGGIVLVTNRHEAKMCRSKLPTLGLSLSVEILVFSELIELLNMSKLAHPILGLKWRTRAHIEKHQLMPRDAIIVLDLEPYLPADCALSIIGVVQWAIDMDKANGADIRILAVSTADYYDLFSNLVHLRDGDRHVEVTDLSHGAEYPHVDVSTSQGSEAVITEVCNRIKTTTDGGQLVISFVDSEPFNRQMEASLEALKPGGTILRVLDATVDMNVGSLVAAMSPKPEDAGKTFLLLIAAGFPMLPPRFKGYEQVHVIFEGLLHLSQGWHRRSCQIVGFPRFVSNQHRWMQLWWAEQPFIPERYVYSTRCSVNDFLFSGPIEQDNRIGGAHLGGFMAAVYDAERWGINPNHALHTCLGVEVRVGIMKKRIAIQGITSKNKFALEGREATIFREALPLVDYDYRLALFLCLESNPAVREVKVQVVALLASSPEGVVDITNDRDSLVALLRDNDVLARLIEFCRGSTKSLAHRGLIWLYLGLWKAAIHRITCAARGMTEDEEAWHSAFGSSMTLNTNEANVIRLRYESLKGRLSLPRFTQLEDEIELDKTSLDEVQYHLFRAYMSQLSIAKGDRDGDQILLAGMVTISKRISCNLLTAFRFSTQIDSEGGEFAFGIHYELDISSRATQFLDWTMIPARIIARWMEEHAPECSLADVLVSTHTELDIDNEDRWVEEVEDDGQADL